MKYEVKNILKKHSHGWQFEGRIIDGTSSYTIAGVIADRPTDGQLKRAITKEMERACVERQKKEKTTKTLSVDDVFKERLSAALEL